jgi:hypothetical protein
VRIEPPAFMRHDRTNGRRFAAPVEVEFPDVPFPDVPIEAGQKR